MFPLYFFLKNFFVIIPCLHWTFLFDFSDLQIIPCQAEGLGFSPCLTCRILPLSPEILPWFIFNKHHMLNLCQNLEMRRSTKRNDGRTQAQSSSSSTILDLSIGGKKKKNLPSDTLPALECEDEFQVLPAEQTCLQLLPNPPPGPFSF